MITELQTLFEVHATHSQHMQKHTITAPDRCTVAGITCVISGADFVKAAEQHD